MSYLLSTLPTAKCALLIGTGLLLTAANGAPIAPNPALVSDPAGNLSLKWTGKTG